jgi:hypothetical protein
MLHYCNVNASTEINEDGFQLTPTPGVEKFKGYMYLIKWTDLPYQACTWELHEDLAASNNIGEDFLKNLRKSYNNAPKAITKMMQQPDFTMYN